MDSTFFGHTEYWRAPGQPQPLIYTNQLLQSEGKSLLNLAEAWELNFEGLECVNINVVISSDRIEEHRVASYVQEANSLLSKSLDATNLTEFVIGEVSRSDELAPAKVPSGRRGGLVYRARRYKPRKSTLVEQVGRRLTLQIVSDEMGRSAGAYLTGHDDILLLLGDRIIEEGNVNYFLHLVGNLVGVPPIWGDDKDDCDDDGFADTPQHSAANYDCRTDHYSSCTGAPEMEGNYMDARYCPDRQAAWTGEQAGVLLVGLTANTLPRTGQ